LGSAALASAVFDVSLKGQMGWAELVHALPLRESQLEGNSASVNCQSVKNLDCWCGIRAPLVHAHIYSEDWNVVAGDLSGLARPSFANSPVGLKFKSLKMKIDVGQPQ
jgi:hypothetical protein